MPKWNKGGLIFTQREGSFFKSHATRPIPYLVNDKKLRIFFASRCKENMPYPSFIDVNPNNPSEVIYASMDPMIQLGRSGCFDDSGVTPGSIVRDDMGRLLMYYSGWKRRRYGVTIEPSIGLAILSQDATKLERYFEGPVLGQDPDHPIFTAAPFVVRVGRKWVMWYCSGTEWKQTINGPEMIYTIYYAESIDGIKWTQFGKKPAIQYDYNGEVISSPWVIKLNEGMMMWYSTRGSLKCEEKNYSAGIAVSKDGILWERRDFEVGIEKSQAGWDSEMVCYPAILNYKDRTYMFYSGNDVGIGGIGYAVADQRLEIIDY